MDNNMLNSFNMLADEFIDKMIILFPNEPKIRGYQVAFRTAKKYNNKKPVEMFMSNIVHFGEQILNRDELFFQKDEYVDHVEKLSGKMGLIQYWNGISEDNKNHIWDYVQNLFKLGMIIIGKKEELMTIKIRQ